MTHRTALDTTGGVMPARDSGETMVNPEDNTDFRRILGHYPTGVCAVTAVHAGELIGLIVGSFTSVSLDPPLVGFLPRRSSASWQRIEASGHFCINVLSHDQLSVCRTLCSRARDKFSTIGHHPSPTGAPVLDGALAWIDCTVDQVHEAGDHLIVVGRVHSLGALEAQEPLLFFRGSYGRFTQMDHNRLAAGDGLQSGSPKGVSAPLETRSHKQPLCT